MMTLLKLGLSIIALLIAAAALPELSRRRQKFKQLPGPYCLPYIGPFPPPSRQYPWSTLRAWAGIYGPIFGFSAFGRDVVIISKATIARELLAKRPEIYADRPLFPNIKNHTTSAEYLPLMQHGEAWRRYRNFADRSLKDLKESNYNGVFNLEVGCLLNDLLEGETSYGQSVQAFAARVSSHLAYGTSSNAPDLVENANKFMHNLSPGGAWTNIIPWLEYLPDWIASEGKRERERHALEYELFRRSLFASKEANNRSELASSHARSILGLQNVLRFTDHEATYNVGMLANVSIMTIEAPVKAWILAMALHPGWQTKVQAEVDSCRSSLQPLVADLSNLPILRATMVEAMRWQPPIPLGAFRQMTEDDTWEGCLMKKGSYVFCMDGNMSQGTEQYPDAGAFNPSRWLDPAFPTYREPLTKFPTIEGHTAFGFGRRACPGQDFVEAEMAAACTAIVWGFNIKRELDMGTGLPVPFDPTETAPYIIATPVDQPILFEVRSAEKVKTIARGLDCKEGA